jgi:hypothetical protein
MRSLNFLLLTALVGLLFATPAQAQSSRYRHVRSHTQTHMIRRPARSVHVKSYTRHTKTGKVTHVRAYNRRTARHH